MKIILCLMGLWISFTSSASDGVIEPDMVVIPTGEFTMGGAYGNEQPKHKVLIPTIKPGTTSLAFTQSEDGSSSS